MNAQPHRAPAPAPTESAPDGSWLFRSEGFAEDLDAAPARADPTATPPRRWQALERWMPLPA
jgi:hypothetical protein